jgi:hypothetical protein
MYISGSLSPSPRTWGTLMTLRRWCKRPPSFSMRWRRLAVRKWLPGGAGRKVLALAILWGTIRRRRRRIVRQWWWWLHPPKIVPGRPIEELKWLVGGAYRMMLAGSGGIFRSKGGRKTGRTKVKGDMSMLLASKQEWWWSGSHFPFYGR